VPLLPFLHYLHLSYSTPFIFFSLIIPRPPTSTLFPYTTLFRSIVYIIFSFNLLCKSIIMSLSTRNTLILISGWVNRKFSNDKIRSEEHTSELQSRFDLVCRLLLEKKKNEKMTRSRTARNRDNKK